MSDPIDKAQDFNILELGSSYELPIYEVIPGQGLTKTDKLLRIDYVRGAKDSENIKKQEGVINETLLGMVLADLKHKYSLVPSEETKQTIEYLKKCLVLLSKRTMRRTEQGTIDTYKEVNQTPEQLVLTRDELQLIAWGLDLANYIYDNRTPSEKLFKYNTEFVDNYEPLFKIKGERRITNVETWGYNVEVFIQRISDGKIFKIYYTDFASASQTFENVNSHETYTFDEVDHLI